MNNLKLPAMDNAELKRYWQYQNGRIYSAKKTGFCIDMLQVANHLKSLSEDEFRNRGIDYSCFKQL